MSAGIGTAIAAHHPLHHQKKVAVVRAKRAVGAGKTKSSSSHPTYADMVKRALVTLHEPKGSSRPAILKYILQHFHVGSNTHMVNAHLRLALKHGVAKGTLKQVKGVGATGSFKVSESKAKKTATTKHVKKAKEAATAVHKTKRAATHKTAKKPRKSVAKKPVKAKTVTVKKAKTIKRKKVAPKKKAH